MVGLVILIVFLAGVVRLTYRGHALSGALMGLGALGLFGSAFLPAAGAWLQHVELPPFYETTSIVGPKGQIFAATTPLARIQRYYINGDFETGWFVNSAGGIFAIGLTQTGQIAVAAARTNQVEFFNADGSPAGPRRSFTSLGGGMDRILRPSNCSVEGVTFVDPVQAENPGRTGDSCPVSALASRRRLASLGVGHVGNQA